MEIKFKNSSSLNFFAAVFCSCVTIFLCIFGIIGGSIVGEAEYNVLALIIFGSILSFIWIVYFIVTFIFYKTVCVSTDAITLKRRKKIIWSLSKADISECVYQKLTFGNFYSPNAATMLFRLKDTDKFAERKISKHFNCVYSISIPYKNAKKIIELGYDVRIIDKIQQQ